MSERRTIRCPAHGDERCTDCSRISAEYLIDGSIPACQDCEYFAETGMHWDTCAGRIRGPITTSGVTRELKDNEVLIPERIVPVKTVLSYMMTGEPGRWTVHPRDLAALLERVADLIDAGLPGSEIHSIVFHASTITVEIR